MAMLKSIYFESSTFSKVIFKILVKFPVRIRTPAKIQISLKVNMQQVLAIRYWVNKRWGNWGQLPHLLFTQLDRNSNLWRETCFTANSTRNLKIFKILKYWSAIKWTLIWWKTTLNSLSGTIASQYRGKLKEVCDFCCPIPKRLDSLRLSLLELHLIFLSRILNLSWKQYWWI